MNKEHKHKSGLLTEHQSKVVWKFSEDLKRLSTTHLSKFTNELQLRKRK